MTAIYRFVFAALLIALRSFVMPRPVEHGVIAIVVTCVLAGVAFTLFNRRKLLFASYKHATGNHAFDVPAPRSSAGRFDEFVSALSEQIREVRVET